MVFYFETWTTVEEDTRGTESEDEKSHRGTKAGSRATGTGTGTRAGTGTGTAASGDDVDDVDVDDDDAYDMEYDDAYSEFLSSKSNAKATTTSQQAQNAETGIAGANTNGTSSKTSSNAIPANKKNASGDGKPKHSKASQQQRGAFKGRGGGGGGTNNTSSEDTSNTAASKNKVKLMIYMGKDKYENEKLLKYGWPEDVWFHVDDLSSAHVYLRLPRGPMRKIFRETGKLDHVPDALRDCCALVKANSIEGSKKASVDVVYTEFENLKKGAEMVDGQVGFVNRKKVVTVKNVPKDKELVKRLEKTQTEDFPDLEAERLERDREVTRIKKERQRWLRKKERDEIERAKKEKEERDYARIMNPEEMTSNRDMKSSKDTSAAVEYEEDFM